MENGPQKYQPADKSYHDISTQKVQPKTNYPKQLVKVLFANYYCAIVSDTDKLHCFSLSGNTPGSKLL
jgi:hypothetical protein